MTRKAQPKLSANGQQALDHYKQVLQQFEDLSPVTTHTYLSDLRQFIAWCEDYWCEGQEGRGFTRQAVAPTLLFPSEKTHGVLTERALGHLVTKYATRAQIADLSLHDLRHRFGYRMAEVVSLHRLAQIMSHDSLDTTMLYVRGTKQDLQQDVETIAWI